VLRKIELLNYYIKNYIFSFKEQNMPSIAIDLGTSNTRVAVWQNGAIKVIKNELGYRTTPSCVAFTATERLIGDAAKSQVNFRIHCMIVSFKSRFLYNISDFY
jgi:molecular chaperone DnaK (HSP70)